MNFTFSRRRPSGFTLIELLAVIAIVGILAAILFSALGHVRRSAQETESLGKLRQIGSATLLYAADHHGSVPVWLNFDTNLHWWCYLQDYLGKNPENFHSPADDAFDASTNDRLIETISYGWNYAVLGRHIGDSSKTGDHTLIMNDFSNPSLTLVAAEAPNESYGFVAIDKVPDTGRYGGRAPCVFLDGHVSSRPPEEFLQTDPWFNPVKALPANK